MPEPDPEFEVSSPAAPPPSSADPAPPPAPPETRPESEDADGEDATAAPAAAKPEKRVDHPGGLPPVEMTRAELDELQAAQARHAQHLAIEDLSRRHPSVRLLAEENAALRARIAELEKGAKKKAR